MDKHEKQKAKQDEEEENNPDEDNEEAKEKPKKETPDKKIEKAAKEEKAAPQSNPIEEAKKVLKDLNASIERANKLAYENLISGKTLAGQREPTDEERIDEGARKLIEGSGFEDRLFPRKK